MPRFAAGHPPFPLSKTRLSAHPRFAHSTCLVFTLLQLQQVDEALRTVLAGSACQTYGHIPGRWAIRVARQKRELNAVVGEHGVVSLLTGSISRLAKLAAGLPPRANPR